eukprot:TRINITY_DN2004_c0_g1_i3.p1 TRINITY_DN2004_c0_g1~~TRINITY_DN2004_c0_g1_i3.p1  ORF type:complete len:1212 (-),score=393.06 TRINITY_DN2004_c0_g1_i3:43-3678(-)
MRPVLLFLLLPIVSESIFGFGSKEDLLTVHVIPHSHCDPGWLQTYEEYYDQYVSDILTGVTQALNADPKKHFIWAEISFFKLWWEQQPIETRQMVKILVENGQLEFVGGGWVQNDEADSSIDIVVNQVTEGHEYILKYFNTVPRFAWQIDPFGHSSLTPTLFSQMGYEGLVINRIHFHLKETYKQSRDMEFLWRPSPSTDDEIFTHVLHTHYSAIQGYDWEDGAPSVAGQQTSRAAHYATTCKNRAQSYRTKHLLVPFGDDFKFRNAQLQFSNMDLIIKEINENPDKYGIKIQYSTLSKYFDAMKKDLEDDQSVQFSVFHGDFFPYADNEDSYWTGYYTSRPALKAMIRESLSMLRSAEMLYAFNRLRTSTWNLATPWDTQFSHLQQARWDTSLTAHHDGVTGTSRQRVVQDYADKLQYAIIFSQQVASYSSQYLLAKPNYYLAKNNVAVEGIKGGDTEEEVVERVDFAFTLPSTIIDTTKNIETGDLFAIAVHNPMGWWRNQIISVKTKSGKVAVTTYDGLAVPIQVNPIYNRDASGQLKEESELSEFEVQFEVSVPPLGLATYFLSHSIGDQQYTFKADSAVYSKSGGKTSKKFGVEEMSIENANFKVTLGSDGLVASLLDKETGKKSKLNIKYSAYNTYRSGAYIFRSNGNGPTERPLPEQVIIIKGVLSEEIQIYGASNKYVQTVRLYRYAGPLDEAEEAADPEVRLMDRVVEVVHTIGNLDVNSEFVVRYDTDLNTDGIFYTDNGIEMRQRQYDQKNPKIEANYYPIQSTILLKNAEREFAVLSRTAMGGSSPHDGTIEMMLHRSCGQDDGRGLSEAMSDSATISVRQWLLSDSTQVLEHERRRLAYYLEHPIRISHSETGASSDYWQNNFEATYEPLKDPLPNNVHVQNLKVRDAVSDEVAINFVNFFEHGKERDFSLSKKVDLDLSDVFKDFELKDYREVSITHNQAPPNYDDRFKFLVNDNALVSVHGLPAYDPSKDEEGDRQNAEEKGVFISKNALENKKKEKEQNRQNSKEEGVFVSKSALDNKPLKSKQRKPLSVEEDDNGICTPSSCGPAILTVEPIKMRSVFVYLDSPMVETKPQPKEEAEGKLPGGNNTPVENMSPEAIAQHRVIEKQREAELKRQKLENLRAKAEQDRIRREKDANSRSKKEESHRDFLIFEHKGNLSHSEVNLMVAFSCAGIGLVLLAYVKLRGSKKGNRNGKHH